MFNTFHKLFIVLNCSYSALTLDGDYDALFYYMGFMKKLITLSSFIYFSLILFPSLISADQSPALAFDPVNQEYLAVYENNLDILGRLVYENGGTDKPVNIEISGTNQSSPAVAFGLDRNLSSIGNYLVAWEDGSTNQDILAKLVSAGGSTGNLITISSNAGSQTSPAITYDNINERFLIVWEDNSGTDYDIYGQLMEKDGSPAGSRFLISTDPGDQTLPADKDQTSPSAAYSVQYDIDTQTKIDNALKTFLVVWEDKRNSSATEVKLDIYGQLINADGSLSGSNFLLSIDPTDHTKPAVNDQTNPSAAYTEANDIDSTNKKFIVVWEDKRSADANIYGQLYDAKNKTLVSANFAVSDTTAAGDKINPSVSYGTRSSSERFLAVWEDMRNAATKQSDIYGQYISTTGTLTGSNFPVSNPNDPDTNAPEQTPAVAYSDYCDNFLIAFVRSGSVTFEDEGECSIVSSGGITGPGSGSGGGSAGTGSSAGGGGCFISTAGYSAYISRGEILLREFSDNFLLNFFMEQH